MIEFTTTLELEFEENKNVDIALQQKAYMRNKFEFYGITTPKRKEIQHPFFHKDILPPKAELAEIIKTLWQKPQREYHYFSQELFFKYVKQPEENDILLFEYMVIHNSWWDTVDFIASKLMGAYFKAFPEKRRFYVNKWLQSNNLWLQRCALLFQLKYKADLDTELLRSIIHALIGSKEFFINKAIGWILREYSKTNPQWVIEFVHKTTLSNLSRKEGLRLVKTNGD